MLEKWFRVTSLLRLNIFPFENALFSVKYQIQKDNLVGFLHILFLGKDNKTHLIKCVCGNFKSFQFLDRMGIILILALLRFCIAFLKLQNLYLIDITPMETPIQLLPEKIRWWFIEATADFEHFYMYSLTFKEPNDVDSKNGFKNRTTVHVESIKLWKAPSFIFSEVNWNNHIKTLVFLKKKVSFL